MMAFGQQSSNAPNSWGVAPGYGEKWPSARLFAESVQRHEVRARGNRKKVSFMAVRGITSQLPLALFHRHTLCEVSWAVNIAASEQ